MNIDSYIKAVLQKMNLAPTANRVNFLRAWSTLENTTAQNNPFATTWNAEPSRQDQYVGGYWFNYNGGYPVKNYSSFDIGVNAFFHTLTAPGYYPAIVAGLQSDKPFTEWNSYAVQMELNKYGGSPFYSSQVAALWDNLKDTPLVSYAGAGLFFAALLLGSILKKWLTI